MTESLQQENSNLGRKTNDFGIGMHVCSRLTDQHRRADNEPDWSINHATAFTQVPVLDKNKNEEH